MPDKVGRSLSSWFCGELAKQLKANQIVESISAQSVQRLLAHHKLKPWKIHYWLRQKNWDNPEFLKRTEEICSLYTRHLDTHEAVLSVDEKTSLQPRSRLAETKAAMPGKPVYLEHEYQRKGALNLLAAFDTRSGKVIGICRRRKRQAEFIELLELLEKSYSSDITCIHIICDNVSTHHGKEVCQWLKSHPRFQFHFTPVHCSWMNQIEQWFSILQRKRFSAPNFDNLQDLEAKIESFIRQWNEAAHPFKWSKKSFQKVLDKLPKNTVLLFPDVELVAA